MLVSQTQRVRLTNTSSQQRASLRSPTESSETQRWKEKAALASLAALPRVARLRRATTGSVNSHFSEDEVNIDSISNRRSGWRDARSEFQSEQHLTQFPIVSAIRRWIEAQKFCRPLFIDIEPGDEVIALQ